MPTVKIRFPGGRYHATPWGHHVNEGLIEWPPSPWRLLRAFVACGFSTLGWTEVTPIAKRLLNKLAAVLPLYQLPKASAAHTRHFMPLGALKDGREQTTLVFDTWADVENGELLIRWPCELDTDESSLLAELASKLGYLGRSESWVEAELVHEPNDWTNTAAWNSRPCEDKEHRGPGWEQVSLVASTNPDEYVNWRQERVDSALAPFPLPAGRVPARLKREREKAIEPFPPDITSCLTMDTSWWKSHKWSQPPGSRRVLYWRETGGLEVAPPAASKVAHVPSVQVMVLALSTSSGNRGSLPTLARALPQAELFHRAIIAIAGKGRPADCPELVGRDESGKPLRTNHGHAHTIPLDLRNDGRIDHLAIFAPDGLGAVAQSAIRGLKRTWTKGGAGEIQIALAGHGSVEVLRELQAVLNQPEKILGSIDGSRVWETATPFVPPRYLKARGNNTLRGQVEAELVSRGLPLPESVEILPEVGTRLRHFIRRRARGGGPPPVDAGFALKLTFTEPVKGPILLGYASHFGLGRFKPIA